MRVLYTISILSLLLVSSCDTKDDFRSDFKNYFIKYYGEDGDQEGVDLIIKDDGSFVLLGNSQLPDGTKRIMLIKTDQHGNVIWQKRLGGTNENAQDIELSTDRQSLLIISNMYFGKDGSSNDELYDLKVLKLSLDGEALDSMIFNNNNGMWKTQFIKSITSTADGGFIVTGNSTDENVSIEPGLTPDIEDLIAIKFSSNMEVKWTLVQNGGGSPGEHYGSFIKAFATADANNLHLFAYSDRYTEGDGDNVFDSNFQAYTATSEIGSLIGVSYYGRPTFNEYLSAVCEAPAVLGSGYYCLGSTNAPGKLYYTKLTSSLARESSGELELGGGFHAVSVASSVHTPGYLILANEMGSTGSSIRLVKVDGNSNVIWSANFGSFNKYSSAGNVVELADGRILIIASIGLDTQRKMALIKVNPQGELLN